MAISASQWVGFLEVWALLGPLLTGGFSQWWSRRNYLADRESDRQNEIERAAWRAEQERLAREEEYALRHKSEKYEELKGAIVEFQATSQQYMLQVVTKWMESIPDKEFTEFDEFTSLLYRQNSHLALLVPEDIGRLIMEVGRTMTNLPYDIQGTGTEDERSRVCDSATQQFGKLTQSLRAYLQTLQ